ncbi:CHAT domain [Actinobacteria bacterium IMCC26256]|nr:CHAT domain [Actinobacteria bacterium IMCC26256]
MVTIPVSLESGTLESGEQYLEITYEEKTARHPWPEDAVRTARIFTSPKGAQVLSPESGGESAPLAAANRESGRPEPRTAESPVDGPENERTRDLLREIEKIPGLLGDLLGAQIENAVRAAIERNETVRLVITAEPTDRALAIPWELVAFDDGGKTERLILSLEPGCSVVRSFAPLHYFGEDVDDRPADLKAEVLDCRKVDDGDLTPLIQSLQQTFGGAAMWTTDTEPTNRSAPNVLFVVGHGDAPRGDIEPRIGDLIPSQLVTRFGEDGWPALTVLVACQSADGSAASPSFASRLIAGGAPAVIGMAGDVEAVNVAPRFVKGLWDALASGASAEGALQTARVAVAAQPGQMGAWQWALPVLHASTGALLPATSTPPDVRGLSALRDKYITILVENNHIGEDANIDLQGGTGTIIMKGNVIGGTLDIKG